MQPHALIEQKMQLKYRFSRILARVIRRKNPSVRIEWVPMSEPRIRPPEGPVQLLHYPMRDRLRCPATGVADPRHGFGGVERRRLRRPIR